MELASSRVLTTRAFPVTRPLQIGIPVKRSRSEIVRSMLYRPIKIHNLLCMLLWPLLTSKSEGRFPLFLKTLLFFLQIKKNPAILNIYIMFKLAKNHTFSHYVKLHVFGK